MSEATVTNGRPRRSLNDSIGRWTTDRWPERGHPKRIRDTLTEAVSMAVAEGVKTALVEVLTNPQVMTRLASNRPSKQVPTLAERMRSIMQQATQAAARWVRSAAQKVGVVATVAAASLVQSRFGLRLLWSWRKPLAVAATIGVAVSLLTLAAPGWMAAVMSGIGGAAVTVVVQSKIWVRRRLRPILAGH